MHERKMQMRLSCRERMSADGRTDTVGENSKIAAQVRYYRIRVKEKLREKGQKSV